MGTLASHEAFALAVNVRACLAKIGVFVGPDGLAVEADYCEVQLDPADIDLTVLFGEANYDTAGDTPIEILPDVFGPGWTATVNQIYADETETAETVWIRIFPPVKMPTTQAVREAIQKARMPCQPTGATGGGS